MKHIQARRHRKLVGPTPGQSTPAPRPALPPIDPDEADVQGWEDEGGEVLPPERRGLARRTATAAGAVIRRP